MRAPSLSRQAAAGHFFATFGAFAVVITLDTNGEVMARRRAL